MKDNPVGEYESWWSFLTHLAYGPEQFGATEPAIPKQFWMVLANTVCFFLAIIFVILLVWGLFLSNLFTPFADEA